jgi:hypothetical protein
VLTEASISGKIDHLRGLKENVTKAEAAAPAILQPGEEDMDFDREIECGFDTPEPMDARPPAGDVE